mmetsp:Transcript_21098/g.54024  ORF Transcript_21098/g.54024 Transcript_21098/m.54024 type:complete len:318 (-) Transcript_21098:579-1532(-)
MVSWLFRLMTCQVACQGSLWPCVRSCRSLVRHSLDVPILLTGSPHHRLLRPLSLVFTAPSLSCQSTTAPHLPHCSFSAECCYPSSSVVQLLANALRTASPSVHRVHRAWVCGSVCAVLTFLLVLDSDPARPLAYRFLLHCCSSGCKYLSRVHARGPPRLASSPVHACRWPQTQRAELVALSAPMREVGPSSTGGRMRPSASFTANRLALTTRCRALAMPSATCARQAQSTSTACVQCRRCACSSRTRVCLAPRKRSWAGYRSVTQHSRPSRHASSRPSAPLRTPSWRSRKACLSDANLALAMPPPLIPMPTLNPSAP